MKALIERMNALVERLMGRFRLRPAEPWEAIGSPSYRAAIRKLNSEGARAIRRRSWDARQSVVRWNFQDCHSFTLGSPRGPFMRFYPRDFWLLRVEARPAYGGDPKQSWWRVPQEDVGADDWECCVIGDWWEAAG